MYDVAIIGAGVVGGMIARTLAVYEMKICILEKENDVATGATKANSAIVHAGFDAEVGTIKASLNVKGAQMMQKVANELGVEYINNGSLVVGFDEEDRKIVEELFERGRANGVKGLEILNKKEVQKIEPNISDDVTCALFAPSAGIVCPYQLAIAAIGNAMDNGADLKRNFEVTAIYESQIGYEIFSGNESVKAKIVINAAGLYSDKIAQMVGDNSFSVNPRKGEYILLDKECGRHISKTIFPTPTKMGKGILVSPTVDGNLIIGPTSENITDKEERKTTAQGLQKIINGANKNVRNIMYSKTITSFCGLRAAGSTGDFIINSPKAGFINVAGIDSPGLSASPAIAEMVADMIKDEFGSLKVKKNYNPFRKSAYHFKNADMEKKKEIIKKDKTYGKVVCRCEGITEGEIREAIRANPKPCDLDGIKRRTRAQMGRCQGGFCTPYIIDLLSQELKIPYSEITKNGGKSKLVTGMTKEDEQK